VAAPAALLAGPRRTARRAIADAAREAAAVVALPEAKTRAGADRIDARIETVAAEAHLPLHRSGGTSAERGGARAVVLRAAAGLRTRRRVEVPADVARIELDRVQAGVHVEPGGID